MKARTIAKGAIASFVALGAMLVACVEPPPKIAAIPPNGLALRVFVFGASAQEARRAFDAVKHNNKSFTIVKEGGDGEVVVGLENDSPKCVAPTALCSFKLAFRVRDNQGNVVLATTTTAAANSDRCSNLCEEALNGAVVKVIEAAAGVLKPASGETEADGGSGEADASADASVGPSSPKSAKKPPAKGGAPKGILCSVGPGPTLPADEAEKRAAQVEALKRIGVIEQDDYDCLRKAYLERL